MSADEERGLVFLPTTSPSPLQPYLGNFGVRARCWILRPMPWATNLTNYALIIVGHAELDTNRAYLTAAAQSNLSWAVSNGVGLVSFDNVLSSNTTALYQFEQDIFGLVYTNAVTSGSVAFPATGRGPRCITSRPCM